jgi:hypothetical protein
MTERDIARRCVLEMIGWHFIQNVPDCTGGNRPPECAHKNCATDECPPSTWIAVVPRDTGHQLPTVEGVPVTSMAVKTEVRAVEWAWKASQEMGLLYAD